MNSAGRSSISSIFQHGLQDGYLSLNPHVKGGLFPLIKRRIPLSASNAMHRMHRYNVAQRVIGRNSTTRDVTKLQAESQSQYGRPNQLRLRCERRSSCAVLESITSPA